MSDELKALLALGVPLIDLGTQLLRNQISKRDAAVAAAKIALSQIPIDELKELLTQADRDRAELGYEVAADFAFGFKAP